MKKRGGGEDQKTRGNEGGGEGLRKHKGKGDWKKKCAARVGEGGKRGRTKSHKAGGKSSQTIGERKSVGEKNIRTTPKGRRGKSIGEFTAIRKAENHIRV